jgi:hypothetical protein
MDSQKRTGPLVPVQPHALLHFTFHNGPVVPQAAEESMEVKNRTLGAGYIQFSGINNLFHGYAVEVCVKIENKIRNEKQKR